MVNPAAIKLAVKAAATILTDEDSRRRVIIIATAPLAAFILIVSLFFYILTMPLQALGGFFSGGDYDTVRNVRGEHGYDQYIDPSDESYLESAGLDFSGVSFTDGATEVFYYNQLDARWKDLPYGVTGTRRAYSHRNLIMFTNRNSPKARRTLKILLTWAGRKKKMRSG